jgi:hypothetical protein
MVIRNLSWCIVIGVESLYPSRGGRYAHPCRTISSQWVLCNIVCNVRKITQKWNGRRNERVYVKCNINVVLQDNYLHGVLVVKMKESTDRGPISSGSLPRIRMTDKALSLPQKKTVKSDSMRMNETKKEEE